jgi:hypothetical protein
MIDRRVLFFGDSLVAGVGDPEGRGWVGRVVEASFGAGMPLTAYNLGVRRETSVEIAGRWQAEAPPRLTPEAECSVVFSSAASPSGSSSSTTALTYHRPRRACQSPRPEFPSLQHPSPSYSMPAALLFLLPLDGSFFLFLLFLFPEPTPSPTSSLTASVLPHRLPVALARPSRRPRLHISMMGGRGRRRQAGSFRSGKRCGGRTAFYGFLYVPGRLQ